MSLTTIIKDEAWLSGPLENVPPILMPAAHALTQAAADLEITCSGAITEKIWMRLNDAPSVGFHLLHITGSIDRLLTYSRDEKLNDNQFSQLKAETLIDESATAEILVQQTVAKINEAVEVFRSVDIERLFEPRTVGRRKLPTNVFGLLFHLAEHTQRHVGQVVATAKIVQLNQQ